MRPEIGLNTNHDSDTSVSTMSYTTESTDILYHYTQYSDTIVTDTTTSISPFTSSLLVTFDLAARLPNTNNAGPTPTESELSGAATVVYAQTVYASRTPHRTLAKLIDVIAHHQPTSSYTALPELFLFLP